MRWWNIKLTTYICKNMLKSEHTLLIFPSLRQLFPGPICLLRTLQLYSLFLTPMNSILSNCSCYCQWLWWNFCKPKKMCFLTMLQWTLILLPIPLPTYSVYVKGIRPVFLFIEIYRKSTSCVISVCYNLYLLVHHQSFVSSGPNPPGINFNDIWEDGFIRVAAYSKLCLHVNQD